MRKKSQESLEATRFSLFFDRFRFHFQYQDIIYRIKWVCHDQNEWQWCFYFLSFPLNTIWNSIVIVISHYLIFTINCLEIFGRTQCTWLQRHTLLLMKSKRWRRQRRRTASATGSNVNFINRDQSTRAICGERAMRRLSFQCTLSTPWTIQFSCNETVTRKQANASTKVNAREHVNASHQTISLNRQ